MLAIYKENDTKYVTKTTNYLLSMIGINFSKFAKMGLIDAYLGDAEREYAFPVMHLLCAPLYDEEFADFCEEVKLHPNFVDDYDVDDTLVMFVFKIPKVYWSDLKLFKEGRFSKINRDFVKKNFKDFKDVRRKVLDKDVYYRKKVEEYLGVYLDEDAELEGIPLPEKEIFRYQGNGWGN